MRKYTAKFVQNGYDTIEIIKEIQNTNDLFDIGIDSENDQRKIMMEIGRLHRNSKQTTKC